MFRNQYPQHRQSMVRHQRPPQLCPDCKKVTQGVHKCQILCAYCHDFHSKAELKDNICPIMRPFAKQQQEKSAYHCKNCNGEGSYLEQITTVRYEGFKKHEERIKQWQQKRKSDPQNKQGKPQRRVINKDVDKKQIECKECGGRGKIMRMVECCSHGCRQCKGDKYLINPIWKKYRRQPIINDEQFSCSICLQEVQVSAQKYVLQCRHAFHPSCIFRWMKDSKKCPVCRQHDFYLEGQDLEPQLRRRQENYGPLVVYNNRFGYDSIDQDEVW